MVQDQRMEMGGTQEHDNVSLLRKFKKKFLKTVS